MNKLPEEVGKLIVDERKRGRSVRRIAQVVGCAVGTVRRYCVVNRLESPGISEAMMRWHELRRQGYVYPRQVESQRARRRREELMRSPEYAIAQRAVELYQNMPKKLTGVLPCGRTPSDCVNCREIFGESCTIRFAGIGIKPGERRRYDGKAM